MFDDLSDILLIDKPHGVSSFGVVARVRRSLSQQAGKKVKVGHTGTLDPFATGLMILVVGAYCKRAAEFSKLDKTYEATIILGKTSTTGDLEGKLTEVSNRRPSRSEVQAALGIFTGVITQTPPIYSAIKVNGQRAYKLAREGREVTMPSREVTVYALEALDYNYPLLKIRAHVSSGTYIRALATDIGDKVRVGAYVEELRRTSVGKWRVEEATEVESQHKEQQ